MQETIKTKICTKCQVKKSVEEFYKRKASKDEYEPQCKACKKTYYETNREKIVERNKEYHQTNAEAIAKQRKIHYQTNRETLLEQKKAYQQANSEKISEKNKAYYQANREMVLEQKQAYYQANTEKIVVRKKAYNKANTNKIAAYQKSYRQINSETIAEKIKAYYQTPMGKAIAKNKSHKRRTITKQGDVTTKQLLELEQNAKVCYWCNASLKNKKVHIDHYVPLSKGGEHTLSNLVVSCAKCNLTKGVKDPLKFAQSIGKLF